MFSQISKGNSDIERYQMANKKIPFKYARPVEEWLQEKGNPRQTRFVAFSPFFSLIYGLFFLSFFNRVLWH